MKTFFNSVVAAYIAVDRQSKYTRKSRRLW